MEHFVVKFFGFEVNLDTLITMWITMALLIVVSFIATVILSIFI